MLKKKKIINDFERSSQSYFKEISEFNPLSREEENSLWEKYKKNNDISARDTIIKSNLKFVASVARPYQGLGLSYSDLIAEGNLGLMKALEKFDYKKGYKTISYSVWWIKQAILDALNTRNLLKGEELPQDFEKPIENEEEEPYISVDPNIHNYIDDCPFEEIKENEEKKAISILLGCLTTREKEIISNYFGMDNKDEMTLEEIGKKMGLTKERVRQIKEKALKKLRSEALKNSLTTDIYK